MLAPEARRQLSDAAPGGDDRRRSAGSFPRRTVGGVGAALLVTNQGTPEAGPADMRSGSGPEVVLHRGSLTYGPDDHKNCGLLAHTPQDVVVRRWYRIPDSNR